MFQVLTTVKIILQIGGSFPSLWFPKRLYSKSAACYCCMEHTE